MTHDEAKKYLWDAVGTLEQRCAQVCGLVLSDEAFLAAPASIDKHHAYPGGLVVHTAEVVQRALAMAEGTGVSRDVLVTAAVWHDYGKRREYRKTDKVTEDSKGYEKTSYRSTIYHISGSYAEFYQQTVDWLPEAVVEMIGHCILSHHGRREWGSPVEPQTQESWILHAADYWSAWFGPSRTKNSETK